MFAHWSSCSPECWETKDCIWKRFCLGLKVSNQKQIWQYQHQALHLNWNLHCKIKHTQNYSLSALKAKVTIQLTLILISLSRKNLCCLFRFPVHWDSSSECTSKDRNNNVLVKLKRDVRYLRSFWENSLRLCSCITPCCVWAATACHKPNTAIVRICFAPVGRDKFTSPFPRLGVSEKPETPTFQSRALFSYPPKVCEQKLFKLAAIRSWHEAKFYSFVPE